MKPLTEEHLAIYRRHMVEIIDMHFAIASDDTGKPALGDRLRTALLAVPRHHFVPTQLILSAYQDGPLPIGFDKTISQPFIAALMMDLLDIQSGDKVLEIGTGYGYQTAVLAELASHVWTIDVVEEFVEVARLRMSALEYANVSLRTGDGSRGWLEEAPFDKIIVAAASQEVPGPLVDQLKPGGRLVMPLGNVDVQMITLLDKKDDRSLATTETIPVRFSPLETT